METAYRISMHGDILDRGLSTNGESVTSDAGDLSLDEWVAAKVAEAPPLTDDQRHRLALLLRPQPAST